MPGEEQALHPHFCAGKDVPGPLTLPVLCCFRHRRRGELLGNRGAAGTRSGNGAEEASAGPRLFFCGAGASFLASSCGRGGDRPQPVSWQVDDEPRTGSAELLFVSFCCLHRAVQWPHDTKKKGGVICHAGRQTRCSFLSPSSHPVGWKPPCQASLRAVPRAGLLSSGPAWLPSRGCSVPEEAQPGPALPGPSPPAAGGGAGRGLCPPCVAAAQRIGCTAALATFVPFKSLSTARRRCFL